VIESKRMSKRDLITEVNKGVEKEKVIHIILNKLAGNLIKHNNQISKSEF
jgi:hypothetical protein